MREIERRERERREREEREGGKRERQKRGKQGDPGIKDSTSHIQTWFRVTYPKPY